MEPWRLKIEPWRLKIEPWRLKMEPGGGSKWSRVEVHNKVVECSNTSEISNGN
jgi:hypothetical protein